MVGTDLEDFIHPEDVQKFKDILRRVIDSPDPSPASMQIRVRHKNGTWRILEGTRQLSRKWSPPVNWHYCQCSRYHGVQARRKMNSTTWLNDGRLSITPARKLVPVWISNIFSGQSIARIVSRSLWWLLYKCARMQFSINESKLTSLSRMARELMPHPAEGPRRRVEWFCHPDQGKSWVLNGLEEIRAIPVKLQSELDILHI